MNEQKRRKSRHEKHWFTYGWLSRSSRVSDFLHVEWVHRDWSGSSEAKKGSSMSKTHEKMLGCEWNGSSTQWSKKEGWFHPRIRMTNDSFRPATVVILTYGYYWHMSRENRLYSRSMPIFQSSSDDFVWVAPLSRPRSPRIVRPVNLSPLDPEQLIIVLARLFS